MARVKVLARHALIGAAFIGFFSGCSAAAHSAVEAMQLSYYVLPTR